MTLPTGGPLIMKTVLTVVAALIAQSMALQLVDPFNLVVIVPRKLSKNLKAFLVVVPLPPHPLLQAPPASLALPIPPAPPLQGTSPLSVIQFPFRPKKNLKQNSPPVS